MKRTRLSCTFAAIAALVWSGPASALSPAGMANTVNASDVALEQIHYRNWRHCHWRDGERFCHRGGRHYNRYNGERFYGYGTSPGIYLRFGGGQRHHGYNRNRWR